MFPLQTNVRSQAGFALLYSVIVIAVLSSLGSVLSNLLVRESRLTATSRQSSRAYYSADAGQECALYWDLQENHFPAPPNGATDEGNIFCSGQDSIDVTAKTESSSEYRYTFSISNNTADICTDQVSVVKQDEGDRMVTEIESIGQNTCGSNPEVRRALRTTY